MATGFLKTQKFYRIGNSEFAGQRFQIMQKWASPENQQTTLLAPAVECERVQQGFMIFQWDEPPGGDKDRNLRIIQPSVRYGLLST